MNSERTLQFIPLTKPFIGKEEEEEVIDTLRSGLTATGPKTERLESEFAAYLGRRHAVGTNSCTAALHLGLLALGIGAEDEVVTTPMTFVATANAIIYVGARPVFVDVEPDTTNIDPVRIEEAITERTKAIIPVHLYGHPCEMDKILDIARRHNLKVICDSAHAIEAEYKGRKVGSLGFIDCFSFYATKNLATGNGGMLVTDDDGVALLVQSLRDHGMSSGAWARYHTGEFQEYPMTNLTGLTLIGNQISDLSPLASLTNLTGLMLIGNQISDLSPLRSLTNLTMLGLEGNQISDLSPLLSLTNLYSLYLESNSLSNETVNVIIPQLEEKGVGVVVIQ